MSTIFGFLLAAVGPLALRVIASLGMSLLVFTGVTASLTGLITMAQTSWSSLPADVLGLAGVAQIPACLGIIAGAMSTRVGIWVAASATRWVTK